MPFSDDLPFSQPHIVSIAEKRKPEQLEQNPKRQRRSLQRDGHSQPNLPLLNAIKDLTPSPGRLAVGKGPLLEQSTDNDSRKNLYHSTLTPAASTRSTLNSVVNFTPDTRLQKNRTSSKLSKHTNNSQLLHQELPTTELSTKQLPKLQAHTQETVATNDTLIDQVQIKQENLRGNEHFLGSVFPSWNQNIGNTDYFDDDETLNNEDWLSLPFEKLIKEETYSIGSSDEEELANLADTVCSTMKQTPPTSALNDMDTSSTIEVFDPTLQRSPPVPSSSPSLTKPNQLDANEELLDFKVDWDSIMLQLPLMTNNSSLSPRLPTQAVLMNSEPPLPDAPLPSKVPVKTTGNRTESGHVFLSNLSKPFTRPPFPAPIRDKSPITGLSNTTVFRTCFRIGHFINEATRCHHQKQDGIFEVYARVTSSSREDGRRAQHFRFVDLFKDQPPHLAGILNGWKTGSLLEKNSASFLQLRNKNGEAKICRCICRSKREKKKDFGWLVDVLSIEEANWDDIEAVRGVVCRE